MRSYMIITALRFKSVFRKAYPTHVYAIITTFIVRIYGYVKRDRKGDLSTNCGYFISKCIN